MGSFTATLYDLCGGYLSLRGLYFSKRYWKRSEWGGGDNLGEEAGTVFEMKYMRKKYKSVKIKETQKFMTKS